MARIYTEQKMYDSAYHYSKISVQKLPQNIAHITLLQKLILRKKDIKEGKSLFQNSKHLKDKILWNNHALLMIALKNESKYEFDEDDRVFAKEAFKLFPNEEFIKVAHKVINAGYNETIIGNRYDEIALKLFSEKKYLEAIENWEYAIELIDNEDSYYLNIAKSYLRLQDFRMSLKILKKLEKLGLKGQDGDFEYQCAITFYQLDKKSIACSYAKDAKNKNYKNSELLEAIVCN